MINQQWLLLCLISRWLASDLFLAVFLCHLETFQLSPVQMLEWMLFRDASCLRTSKSLTSIPILGQKKSALSYLYMKDVALCFIEACLPSFKVSWWAVQASIRKWFVSFIIVFIACRCILVDETDRVVGHDSKYNCKW